MAITSNIGPIYRGEDILLNFTMTPVVNILGWGILFTVKSHELDTTTLLTISGVVVNAAAGTFSVTLTAAQTNTLQPDQYVWDVWRTDLGSASVLALGKLTVRDTPRVP